MAYFMNLTPHDIRHNDGHVFKASGVVARVSATYSEFDKDCICEQTFGLITDLPLPQDGMYYIVSALVLAAAKAQGRTDCIAPATGHPECVRKDGFIVSVPGFVK